jgi:hypothetical protein
VWKNDPEGYADQFQPPQRQDHCRRHGDQSVTRGEANLILHGDPKPSNFWAIASHTWDTLDAVAAGCEAALITRPRNDVLGVGRQLQIVGGDLNDVGDQFIAHHGAKT